MSIKIDHKIIKRFDVPGPRYTSYPTAPNWEDTFDQEDYIEKLRGFGDSQKTLSLYVHLPFCQSLCRFCACNVIIRRQDKKYGDEYLKYLFKEIELVSGYIGQKKSIRQFHWGGGTPTFLDEEQIERLFCKIKKHFIVEADAEIAIEIDPRTIDNSKVKKLYELGFNRVSMGVQDFDEEVQKAVNRIQPLEIVDSFYSYCRQLGFDSVNFDLIYGLPKQTFTSFIDTIEKVIDFKPDRIALYSFALVPWLKKHQNNINQRELPENDQKIEIFLQARSRLMKAGYQAIAMDHFALPSDEMAKAFNKGQLYRNFMGYTVKPADEFIGLGLTSIGFLENTFIQNEKTLKEYYGKLSKEKLPVERGKILSEDDRARQWTINCLMCHFKVNKNKFKRLFQADFNDYFKAEQDHIRWCVNEGLLKVKADIIDVTSLGKFFVRNICMGFDYYLMQKGAHKRFSKTV